MDETTLQIYSGLVLLATALLVYAARLMRRRRAQRRIAGLERLPAWTGRAIETNRPLHLSFGSAGIGGDNTPLALAGNELFHHIIAGADAGDAPPMMSMSAAMSLPLAQDTARRAWNRDGDLTRLRWLPSGRRSLAYAAALTDTARTEEPAAHVLAGSFGPELALILDSAERRGQPSLAASDQLAGQAVAYALADEALIGEELFAAPAYVADDGRAGVDSIVMDLWRVFMIIGVTIALFAQFSQLLPEFSWPLLAAGGAVLLILGMVGYIRR